MNNINEYIEKIKATMEARIEQKKQRYPRNTFIASDITECDRYLVHSVLDWDKREIPGNDVFEIMENGTENERILLKQFIDAGLEVVEYQQPFELQKKGETILRGKIDGKFKFGHDRIPFEIKTVGENIFKTLNNYEDFFKKTYLKKYIFQTQLYLYGHNYEKGLIVLYSRGHKKYIPVELQYDLCGNIVEKLEKCWDYYVKQKQYPERQQCEWCDICSFRAICLPDSELTEAQFLNDEHLIQLLDEYFTLKEVAERYEDVYDEIKESFKTTGNYIVGNYLIKVKTGTQKRIDTKLIPEGIKKDCTKIIETKNIKIEKMDKK